MEFLGGSLGTAAAAIVPACMIANSMQGEGKKAAGLGLAAFPAYAVSSAFASAAGAYFVGRLFGQHGSFWHALAGGAAGGLGGSVSLFSALSSGGQEGLALTGFLLPPTCSVIVFNVWRNHGSE